MLSQLRTTASGFLKQNRKKYLKCFLVFMKKAKYKGSGTGLGTLQKDHGNAWRFYYC